MDTMIACCGLNCAACEAYLATKANDPVELEKIAARWREEYSAPGITIVEVNCLGCNSSGPWCGHCYECNIRACAQKRNLSNCASCEEFPCEELSQFFQMVPVAQENLQSFRNK